MMFMWWLAIIGVLVLLAAAVDLIWTTLGTHGGGPLSGPLTNFVWAVARRAARGHHRLLSFAGSFILGVLLLFWVMLTWTGWALVFISAREALIDAKTHAPAGAIERIFFVGSSMFTSGTAEYNPKGHAWHLAAAGCAGSGLFVVTMSITYIMSVLAATVEKRALGSYVWDLGATPERIIERMWDGEQFEDLHTHLNQFVVAIELFGEQNLAYPILEFFHSENRRTAEPLRIAAMLETLILPREGVLESVRPSRLVLLTAIDAIRGLGTVVESEFVDAAAVPPPPPDIGILHRLNIPARPEPEFVQRVSQYQEVRRRLLGLIEKAGWSWSDVFSTKFHA